MHVSSSILSLALEACYEPVGDKEWYDLNFCKILMKYKQLTYKYSIRITINFSVENAIAVWYRCILKTQLI